MAQAQLPSPASTWLQVRESHTFLPKVETQLDWLLPVLCRTKGPLLFILVCPAVSQTTVNGPVWLAACGMRAGAEQKTCVPYFCVPSENLPVDSPQPLTWHGVTSRGNILPVLKI
jgi:hypothetical protein